MCWALSTADRVTAGEGPGPSRPQPCWSHSMFGQTAETRASDRSGGPLPGHTSSDRYPGTPGRSSRPPAPRLCYGCNQLLLMKIKAQTQCATRGERLREPYITRLVGRGAAFHFNIPGGKPDRAAMNKGVYGVHLNAHITQSTGVAFEGRPRLCAPPAMGGSPGLPSKLRDHLICRFC